VIVKITLLSSASTISTRVLANAPPATRKLPYGWLTRNDADDSVPLRALPRGALLTQYCPAGPSRFCQPCTVVFAASTIANASPVAFQLSSVPASKSRFEAAGATPSDGTGGASETSIRPSMPAARWPGSEQK
jgi:hypothetical protein